jgi:hypothetical protein
VAAFCVEAPLNEFDLFLTTAEKVALTGCKTKKGQIRALRRMHIAFFLSTSHVPIVSRLAAKGSSVGREVLERVVTYKATLLPRLHS